MWIKFTSTRPYAVQIYLGAVNAVSGKTLADLRRQGAQPSATVQDYVVVPDQKWIDGIATEAGTVRQFVATLTGSGHSVEMQVTGREEYAGLLFSVKPSFLEDELKVYVRGQGKLWNYCTCELLIKNSDTIGRVIEKFHAKRGSGTSTNAHRQRLSFAGEQLESKW
jgi:hypothetical protein